jgi:hypothetical protein
MYTEQMRRAFRSITPPSNFGVDLIDNDNFIVVRADEHKFIRLHHDEKIEAVQYMVRVKKALEDCGAVVMLMRKEIK